GAHLPRRPHDGRRRQRERRAHGSASDRERDHTVIVLTAASAQPRSPAPACHAAARSLVWTIGDRLMWNYSEAGAGSPLVLLHGIGMSHRVWDPVIPLLRTTRRIIAFDVAGFGSTPPLPAGTPPTVGNLAGALEQSLHELGVDLPIDIAGNSLGGLI